jgi:hypothetical protein
MSGEQRRRRRIRRGPESEEAAARAPSPSDLAGRATTFALTSGVQDPEEPDEPPPTPEEEPPHLVGAPAETHSERGLRGLVGGGSSQVGVSAALRARDAARPTDDDLARADTDLVIVRRGWVPREDLPHGPRR